MTLPLPIRADRLDDERRLALTGALATLPDTFRLVDDGPAVAVDGSQGWAARAVEAAENGAPAILLIDPNPPRPADVSSLDTLRIPVVVSAPWLNSEAVTRAAPSFQRLAGRDVLLEARATTVDIDRAMVALLATVTRLVDDRIDVTLRIRRDATALVQATTGNGTRIVANVFDGPVGRDEADIRITRGTDGARVCIPAPTSAHPARISTITNGLLSVLETSYISTHRASLIRLRDAIARRRVVDDLDRYRAAVESLSPALPPH